MSGVVTADTARLPMLLTQLRLPTIARLWPAIAETADRESWPAARTLAALLEHEIAERAQRRTARHLLEARLPPGKTLDSFDFTAASSLSKARVIALAEGDTWLAQGTNILLFGPPGVGKSHLAAALGHALIDAGYRVLFQRTSSSSCRPPDRNFDWRLRSRSSTATTCSSSMTSPTFRRARQRRASYSN